MDDYQPAQVRHQGGDRDFALRSLFRGLFRSTNRNIQVVTTNYDRVAEYAADSGGYIHNTGFLPGYLRRADGAENLIFQTGRELGTDRDESGRSMGHFDWFSDPHGGVMSLPMTSELPDGLVPLIVTPGVSKYQRTHDEPFRSAIQGADQRAQRRKRIHLHRLRLPRQPHPSES
jgi:hypothetical protein